MVSYQKSLSSEFSLHFMFVCLNVNTDEIEKVAWLLRCATSIYNNSFGGFLRLELVEGGPLDIVSILASVQLERPHNSPTT